MRSSRGWGKVRPGLLALEPRFLFDASLAAVVADGLTRELVVVDPTVADWQLLVADLSDNIERLVLDPNRDGVAQIAEHLAAPANQTEGAFSAVHLLTHGASGQISLGSATLSFDTLGGHAEQLARWSAGLTAEADLLLYGCEVAAGERGEAFVRQLAEATGADVAASTDVTGSIALGGDWALESQTGVIETHSLDNLALETWNGILASSPPAALASSFVVNTYTTDNQSSPSLDVLENGNFVIVWTSANQDGSGNGVYGQVLDPDGNRIGTEFRANSYTSGNQQLGPYDSWPPRGSVSGLTDGNFVVVWESNGQDGSNLGVYGQLFSPTGSTIGSEFRVNTYTSNAQRQPSVAGLSGGGFVVAYGNVGLGGGWDDIYMQRFDASGVKLGGETRVNTYTSNDQEVADVVDLSDGGFMVVWTSQLQDDGTSTTDGERHGIYGQRLDASGNKIGSEFRINSYVIDDQGFPAVTRLNDGNLVVTWQSRNQDGSDWGMYGQIIDIDGNKIGSEFLVNTITDGYQLRPSVTALEDGGFLIAWQTLPYSSFADGHAALLQRFDATGAPVADAFGLSDNYDESPAVVALGNGKIVATWADYLQDGNGRGISAQIFEIGTAPVLETWETNPLFVNLGESEDSIPVSSLLDGIVYEPQGVAVTGLDSTNGAWFFSMNGGVAWQPFGVVSSAGATLLRSDPNTLVRFQPDPSFTGSASITFRAWDISDGRANGDSGVDVSLNGGNTAYSRDEATRSISALPPGWTIVQADDAFMADEFASNLSISGEYLLVGSRYHEHLLPDSGAAFVFQHQPDGSWRQVDELLPTNGRANDNFGFSVSLSGTYAIVGSLWDDDMAGDAGSAYLFERQENGDWSQSSKLLASDGATNHWFGFDVAVDGDWAIVGAPSTNSSPVTPGYAYIFQRQTDGTWTQQAKLAASNGQTGDRFGSSVALSGETALIGAYSDDDLGTNSGAAYMFQRQSDGSWSQTAALSAPDGAAGDNFGANIALSGELALISCTGDDDLGEGSGSVYVFQRQTNGAWQYQTKFLPENGQAGDGFGYPFISGNYAIVGALRGDGTTADSGALYLFHRRSDDTWVQTKIFASDGAYYDQFGIRLGFADGVGAASQWYENSTFASVGAVYTFPINFAPELDTHSVTRFSAIPADAANPSGEAVSALLGTSVRDEDDVALEGMAVVGRDNTHGAWQYSLDHGVTWTSFGFLADSSATLLPADASMRFLPHPGWSGSSSISFRAWDRTYGAGGQSGVNTSLNGGTSSFSTSMAMTSLEVLANNIPALFPVVTPYSIPPQGNTPLTDHVNSPTLTASADLIVSSAFDALTRPSSFGEPNRAVGLVVGTALDRMLPLQGATTPMPGDPPGGTAILSFPELAPTREPENAATPPPSEVSDQTEGGPPSRPSPEEENQARDATEASPESREAMTEQNPASHEPPTSLIRQLALLSRSREEPVHEMLRQVEALVRCAR